MSGSLSIFASDKVEYVTSKRLTSNDTPQKLHLMKSRFRLLLLVGLAALAVASCLGLTSSTEPDSAEFELPALLPDEEILRYEGFTVSYNRETLTPNWVAYELTREEVQGQHAPKVNFGRDPNLHGRQASREDYARSGWDRGHMAPKADMKWSETAYSESFYLTNICPQNHELNAGDWNTVEKMVRRLANRNGNIYIVCGPLYDNNAFGSIGTAGVRVPDAFFKALLTRQEGRYTAVAFVMDNQPQHHPLRDYSCTVDELEALLGRDLFAALPDSIEAAVESTVRWADWNR